MSSGELRIPGHGIPRGFDAEADHRNPQFVREVAKLRQDTSLVTERPG
jgi:hypothetical protein